MAFPLMKKLLVIALIMCIAHLQAQVRIGDAEAYSTAEQFVSQQGKQGKPTLTLSEEIKSKQSGQTNLFVFSMEPKGYVVVSALNDVLAYSFESSMPTLHELPDHVAYWINLYNERTDYLLQHPDQIKKPAKQQRSVEPLLISIWGQGCYHNAACPYDTLGPCHHVEAGCVAIAMAQIMYYHKYPSTGTGSMTYTCSPFGTLTANFENTSYQWESMADTLFESNQAVATLVYHCGVAVNMKYSSNGSGAYSKDVPDAFHRYFLYPSATYLKRESYNDEEWQRILKNDLDRQHPVYYAGNTNLSTGHAFVCDGYDNNGLFHFNFGWDGVADGYYTLSSPYGFSEYQSIVHDIYPIDEIPIHSDSHGIIYVADDGTGDGSSWAQATSELRLALFKSTMDSSSIWVKEGLYKGNPEQDFAFTPLFRCRLYGGFKGDEPYDYDLSQRDFEAHPSILDGSQTQGVIGGISNNDLMIIDGFIIQNGNATQGGGILLESNTQIRNCTFCHNHARSRGGAISQRFMEESRTIVIEDCEFFDNDAQNNGGAVYDYGNTSFLRCNFHDNRVQHFGGGVYCITYYSPSQFINCTFSNNTAQKGGGITVSTSQGPAFWNCLINNNTAETGGGCYLENGGKLFNCTIVKNEAQTDYGGIYVSPSAPLNWIRNCIIWGNVSTGENTQIGPIGTYSYCAVEGDLSEENFNFKADEDNDGSLPRFYVRFQNPNVAAGVTGQGGNWRLQSNSPCINRGRSISNQPATDLDGNQRLKHEIIDLGAYESDVAAHIINAYYCEDEPYYYQDSLLSELGSYTFLFPATPYDSLLVIQMQLPPPTVFLNEEICANETYDFFGVLLNEPGQYTATERCVTYRLKLTMKPLDSIAMKEEICEGDTYDFFGEPLYGAGHYSTLVNCIDYELDLTVNPTTWDPILMEEEICEGDTYDFFGISLHNTGHYSTTLDCTTYDLDLDVRPLPKVHCSNDTLVEYGNLVQLTASGADSYLWSTGDTTQCITVYSMTDRTYTVYGYSQNGCSDMASVTVRVANEADEIVLYPNPANNKVEIYMPLIDEVEVFNALGMPLDRTKAKREVVELDVSTYPTGVYIVHVRQLNNHYYKKLVIQH